MEDSDGDSGDGAAASPFTVMHQRSCAQVRAVALCSTMDLVAILLNDGTCVLHRTMSWERVLSKSAGDLVEASNNVPITLCFNHNGKVLGFGCDHGEITVFCVETAESMGAHKLGASPSSSSSSNYNISTCSITSLAWLRTEDNKSNQSSFDSIDYTSRSTWASGGTDLAARVGLNEHNEPSLAEIKDKSRLEALFTFAESSILLALATDHKVVAYIFGIFPLFSVDLSVTALFSSSSLRLVSSGSSYSLSSGIPLRADVKELHGAYYSSSLLCLRSDALLSATRLHWHEHSAKIFLAMLADLGRLQDLLGGLGKKWKEATRVVLGKLGLLQGSLDTYELKLSVVEFLYSTAMCGLWHPAATTSFSQHWNEQGLARLRSAVDLTSKSIIKQLYLKAIPLATNISLRSRELLAVSGAASAEPLQQFLSLSEALLLKLDAALAEARLARDAMLLFLQFIKESSAAATPAAAATSPKLDMALRRKALTVLNPLVQRASWKGKDAQAEYVCGSHLYAYLQDSELPADIPALRSAVLGLQRPSEGAALGGELLEEMRALVAEVEAASGTPAAECRRSLPQQIRAMRERLSEALSQSHGEVSQALAKTLPLSPCSLPQRSPHGAACAWLLASMHINGEQCLSSCLVQAYVLSTHLVAAVVTDGDGRCVAAMLRLPSSVSQPQLYVREEGTAQQQVHLLCTGTDEGGACVLFKIDLLTEVSFSLVTSPAAAGAALDLQALARSLPSQQVADRSMRLGCSPDSSLACSGGRGVALLTDAHAGRVLLLDIETEGE